MFRVTCPTCREMLEFAGDQRGAIVACAHCGKRLRLPPVADAEDAGDAPRSRHGSRAAARDEDVERADDYLDDAGDEEQVEDRKPTPRKKRKLGEVEKVLRRNPKAFIWHGIGMASLIAAACYFLYEALNALRGRMGDRLLTLSVCTFIALALLGLCGLLFWRTSLQWNKRVLVADNGFAIVRGGRRSVYLWDDIAEQCQQITDHYVNGAFQGTSHLYTLKTVDGERIILGDELKMVKRLGDIIAQKITERELPRALDDYDDGRLVTFGSLGVDEKGLSYGESFLRWKEIESVGIAQGCISVSKKGKWLNWCNIPAAKVPNLQVFLALVDEIKGVKGL